LATPTDPLMDDAGLADARRTEHSQHSIAGIGDGVEQRVALFVGLEARQISAATDLVAPLSPGLEPLWLVKSKRAALLLGGLRLVRADKVGESVGVDELELLSQLGRHRALVVLEPKAQLLGDSIEQIAIVDRRCRNDEHVPPALRNVIEQPRRRTLL